MSNNKFKKYSPYGLYNATVQCNNLRRSSYVRDDGPVWSKHVVH
jgi:hypothetical protein